MEKRGKERRNGGMKERRNREKRGNERKNTGRKEIMNGRIEASNELRKNERKEGMKE